MTEAISICFDCKKAYASKCTKIHDGVPIKGSVVKPIRGGYFRVIACPRFESDCVKTKSNICKVLGISAYQFRRCGIEWVQNIAERQGYLLVIEEVGRSKQGVHYYLRSIEKDNPPQQNFFSSRGDCERGG